MYSRLGRSVYSYLILFVVLFWIRFINYHHSFYKNPIIFLHQESRYESSDFDLNRGSLFGVTLIRNKAPFLKEWLDFHLAQGFDQFIIYNHNVSDEYSIEVLLPYIVKNQVILIDAMATAPYACDFHLEGYNPHWYSYCQDICFTHGMEIVRHNTIRHEAWVLQFDIDEYVFGLKGKCFRDAFDQIKENYDVVHMKGFTFGTNFFEYNQQFSSVIHSHFLRAPSYLNATDHKKLILVTSPWPFWTTTHDVTCYLDMCNRQRLPHQNDWIRFHHYQYISNEEAKLKAKTNTNLDYVKIIENPAHIEFFNSVYDESILNVTICPSIF